MKKDLKKIISSILANCMFSPNIAYMAWYNSSGQSFGNTLTKLTGLSLLNWGPDDCFDTSTADQITIKKSGMYLVNLMFRVSAVTNQANVKRVSLCKNGASEALACLRRSYSWEDSSTCWPLQFAAGDVLTLRVRAEDGASTYTHACASIQYIG